MLILRKILVNLIILFCIIFIIDRVCGGILKGIYFKQDHGYYYALTYAITKMNSPMVIMGTSRAHHHYIPSELQKAFNMRAFNAGNDDSYIFFQEALLTCILKRYNPNIIILDLLDDEFLKGSVSYDKLNILLPYCEEYPEIEPLAYLKSPFEKYKAISKIYPYNSAVFEILTGWLNVHNKRDSLSGFVPLYGVWNKGIQKIKYDSSIDVCKVQAFESFVNMCKKHGIQLYVFVSPSYGIYDKSNRTLEIAAQLAQKNGYVFHSYLDYSIFNDPDLFNDPRHLNVKGARLFTNLVIEDLKKSETNKVIQK
ncbi:MAG TPA: hypothetical protein VGQ53_04625 [Chitinophagaceae bacterium]|jgi:hypothetical protein|nr:hypothetical protein [Chitinophagaceae bacterium]